MRIHDLKAVAREAFLIEHGTFPDFETSTYAACQARRKANLRRLVQRCGGATALAKILGFAGPSYISQIVGTAKPITEKTTARIEHKLGLPRGWLDADSPPSAPFA